MTANSDPTRQVSLRLPLSVRRKLEAAGKPHGVSGPVYAKFLLTELLNGEHVLVDSDHFEELHNEVDSLRTEIETFRQDFAKFEEWVRDRAKRVDQED